MCTILSQQVSPTDKTVPGRILLRLAVLKKIAADTTIKLLRTAVIVELL